MASRFAIARVTSLFTFVFLTIGLSPLHAQGSDPQEWTLKAQDRSLLLLKYAEFDPTLESPAIPDDLRHAPGWLHLDHDYYVVQFAVPLDDSIRRALADLDAAIMDYVPNDAYVLRLTQDNLARMEAWSAVRAIVPLHPAFRLTPDLLRVQDTHERVLNIFLFEGENDRQVEAAITRIGAIVLRELVAPGRLRVRARVDHLDDLARISAVQWIQEEPQASLRNDRTTWVIQSNSSGSTPLWDRGLHGEGQVIGHIDDAIDIDNCYFHDPSQPNPGPNHRKVVYHNGSTSRNGDHGTHTAGTAAGDQEPINGGTFRNGLGYAAKIAHHNLNLISGSNLDTRLQQLYNNGARVMTNSWGNDGTTSYDGWARDIDLFSWNNEDALAMWAVTNGSTLRNPENAKDCLAVGATDQTPNQDSHCTGGRGPTSDGRRKPEIYAPGCSIRSPNAGTSCSTQSMSGTSMASPAICGAAALVRQYFTDGYYPSGSANGADSFTPTGALLKSVLLNASVNMTGVSGYPSNTEGWGRVWADKGLYFNGDTNGMFIADVRKAAGFTSPGQSITYDVEVLANGEPLEITLSWHDAPAALFANFTPVNDLDLRVTSPNGLVYRGNVFSGGQSMTGGSRDSLNNVERVRRDVPEVGIYRVEISSAVIGQSGQGYGLAVSAILTPCEDDCGGGGGDPPGDCVDPNNYGNATAGTNNIEPTIEAQGWPFTGNQNWVLRARDFLGGISGTLIVGFADDNDSSLGWTRLVALNANTLIIPVAYSGAGPGSGQLDLNLAVPNNPFLHGLDVYFQFTGFDAGAAAGVSATDGLHATICDPNG